jgi:hypothetical protein
VPEILGILGDSCVHIRCYFRCVEFLVPDSQFINLALEVVFFREEIPSYDEKVVEVRNR